jgi:hypothetical protein
MVDFVIVVKCSLSAEQTDALIERGCKVFEPVVAVPLQALAAQVV